MKYIFATQKEIKTSWISCQDGITGTRFTFMFETTKSYSLAPANTTKYETTVFQMLNIS